MLKTRITPTPSGHIHIGNAYNFALCAHYAKEKKAQLLLRIDDFDFERTRSEYVEDIFSSLKWLHIHCDQGPKNQEDFYENYSLQKKQDLFWSYAQRLIDKDLAYACDCTRSLKNNFTEQGAYRGHCSTRNLKFVPTKHSLRLRCPDLPAHQRQSPFELNKYRKAKQVESDFYWLHSLKDFVIWTKDNTASYQLISVVLDYLEKVTTVFRGQDLEDSTGAQIYLAKSLGEDVATIFNEILFLHHPLLEDPGNPLKKFSKSHKSYSLKEMIGQGYTLESFRRNYEVFFRDLKI